MKNTVKKQKRKKKELNLLLLLQKKVNRANVRFVFLSITFFAFLPGLLFPQQNNLKKFQEECEKLFYNVNGTLGVADLQTEKIIVTVNKKLLLSGSNKPGSIFKIITSIAALKSGQFSGSTSFECEGKEVFDGESYSCWLKKGHGNTLFANAIAHSCNIFFYNIAFRLDYENLYDVCDDFYIGRRTPFALNGEGCAYFKKQFNPVEKMDLCLGQSSNLLVTPLQMLYMISVVAKRGKFTGFKIDLNSEIYSSLYSGLYNSVKFGTAKESNYIRYEAGGKTGTSSKSYGKKTNSWFVGFAPFNNPKIAIIIFLNYGRGAIDAAPMAKKIFKSFFSIYYSDPD